MDESDVPKMAISTGNANRVSSGKQVKMHYAASGSGIPNKVKKLLEV